jgi:hypothetical protein
MSITRASGKAYRIPLSFLAVMAGLEVTPAEEMPRDEVTQGTFGQEPNGHQGGIPASAKQLAAIRSFIDHPLVYVSEKRSLHALLEAGDMTRQKASEIMNFYLGVSVKGDDGSWVKSTRGKLSERKQ